MAGGGGAAGEGGGEGGWQRRSYCSTARSGLRGRGPRGRAGAPEAGPVADRGGTNTGPRRVCQHWHRRRGGHLQPPRRRKGAEAPTARQSVGRGRRGSAGHCQWRAARRGGRPGSHGTSRAACQSADGINVAADGTPRGRVGGAERPSRGSRRSRRKGTRPTRAKFRRWPDWQDLVRLSTPRARQPDTRNPVAGSARPAS